MVLYLSPGQDAALTRSFSLERASILSLIAASILQSQGGGGGEEKIFVSVSVSLYLPVKAGASFILSDRQRQTRT